MISLGIQQFILETPSWLVNQRLALLCNQASTNDLYIHSRDLIAAAYPGQLTCLFSPQHGFMAEKQDNMVESGHGVDRQVDIPLFSLYGDERQPTPAMLELFDVLLVDLFDVGTRVYTFMSTLALSLQEAAKYNKRVVVLDRPNPIGGDLMEGNIIADDCRSFVGLYPLPMRHGMTIGELALFINAHLETPAELTIVPMTGWSREMNYPDTKLPWVYPSPNMPTFQTAAVYPGQVIWEGTNISEGRGTSLPFELCGAPFIDPQEVLQYIENIPLPGCHLRPVGFEPTSNKWQGRVCYGFQIHITNINKYRPYRTSLALLQAFSNIYSAEFTMQKPPYEYEYERQPLDLILGDIAIRKAIMAGENLLEIENSWQKGLQEFSKLRENYLLY